MLEDLRRVALFGSGVAELTRNKAEALVKDLVDKSKQNRSELAAFIRMEVHNQIRNLGLVTRRDLDRLERRITRLEENLKKSTARKPAAPKASTARSAGAAKSTVRGKTTPPTVPPGTPPGGSTA